MYTIRVEKAGKLIKDKWVLKDVTVLFESGKIHGLTGRNGAGKTMLLRSICGLTRLTSGAIYVEDKRVGEDVDVPDSVGAIIDAPRFLPNFSGFSNLKYLASLKKAIGDDVIMESMKIVGLASESKIHVSRYSLGMQQRLGIAQAIMENPNILLLDEPLNGLDKRGIAEMKTLFRNLREQGKTIVLASHHMEDINELCDTVTVMEGGKLISQNKANEGEEEKL